MPQQQTTENQALPAPLPVPAVLPERGALSREFQQKSVPFYIDLKPFESDPNQMALDDIHKDPSFAEHLRGRTVFTDNFRDRVFTSELNVSMALISESLRKNEKPETSEHLRWEMLRSADLFMDGLKTANPELHSKIEKMVKQVVGTPATEPLGSMQLSGDLTAAEQTLKWAQNFKEGYFAGAFLEYSSSESRDDRGNQVIEIRETIEPFVFLPGSNFNTSDSLKDSNAFKESRTPIPGTDNEWAAFITAHEIEHFTDGGQAPITNHFQQRFKDSFSQDDFIMRKLYEMIIAKGPAGNAKEIESDIAAAQSLEGKIDPAIPAYWAAIRIGDSMINNLPAAMNQENAATLAKLNLPREVFVVDVHNTGYHLSEYLTTGTIPDYDSTRTAIDGFYDKTAEALRNEIKRQLPANMPAADSLIPRAKNLSLSDTVDLVQQLLARDPPVYSPAEAHIAQTFVQNMTETLGIERGSLDFGVRDIIDDIKSLSNTIPRQPEPPENRQDPPLMNMRAQ